MSMVHQTADNMMIITTPGGAYVDTIANFQLDFGDTVPSLPQGANDRIYDQGIRHAISNGWTIIAGGHQPWTQGDNWINNIQTGLANQTARQGAQHAQQIAQASQDDGSSSPQPSVRQESRSAPKSGEGVQSGRQRNWDLAKEKTEELKRRI